MTKISILVEGYVRDNGQSVQSTVTLIQDGGKNIVADPGMTKDPQAISKALDTHGLTPDDIDYVFITHHHPDHTRHMGLFPNAVLVDFWATYDKDQWFDTEDGYSFTPNTKVILAPGHSQEDAALVVSNIENLEAGKVVSAAICHLWWYKDKQDDPQAWDADALKNSRQKVTRVVDYIIPGHGAPFKVSEAQI